MPGRIWGASGPLTFEGGRVERFVVVVRSGEKVIRTNSRKVAEYYAARFNGEVVETYG